MNLEDFEEVSAVLIEAKKIRSSFKVVPVIGALNLGGIPFHDKYMLHYKGVFFDFPQPDEDMVSFLLMLSYRADILDKHRDWPKLSGNMNWLDEID